MTGTRLEHLTHNATQINKWLELITKSWPERDRNNPRTTLQNQCNTFQFRRRLDRNMTGTLQTTYRNHIAISIITNNNNKEWPEHHRNTCVPDTDAKPHRSTPNARRPWPTYDCVECQAERFNKNITGTWPEQLEHKPNRNMDGTWPEKFKNKIAK